MLTPIIWSIGEFFWADGICYEDQFNDYKIYGKVIYESSDDIKYDGGWKNNKTNGAQ